MRLQDQVCLPEQGERLKELGVAQESLFYWTHSEKWGIMPRASIDFSGNPTSVFTVAELGVMLPNMNFLPDSGINYSYYHRNCWRGHSVGYSAPMRPDKHIERGWFKNEAEARADLLIHLLENNYLTAEEINQRLTQ